MPAASCLAITFTRRAAAEMEERLAALIPAARERIAVHTFHSLGLSILARARRARRSETRLPHRRGGGARRRARRDAWRFIDPRGAALRAISKAKRTGSARERRCGRRKRRLCAALAARNWIDFDDLVGRSVDLLTAEPALASVYQERFRIICVDEFQDVDEQQFACFGS